MITSSNVDLVDAVCSLKVDHMRKREPHAVMVELTHTPVLDERGTLSTHCIQGDVYDVMRMGDGGIIIAWNWHTGVATAFLPHHLKPANAYTRVLFETCYGRDALKHFGKPSPPVLI